MPSFIRNTHKRTQGTREYFSLVDTHYCNQASKITTQLLLEKAKESAIIGETKIANVPFSFSSDETGRRL